MIAFRLSKALISFIVSAAISIVVKRHKKLIKEEERVLHKSCWKLALTGIHITFKPLLNTVILDYYEECHTQAFVFNLLGSYSSL